MSQIKNAGLDQYGAKPFEQQQFGTADVEGVNEYYAFLVAFKCYSIYYIVILCYYLENRI